MPNRGTARFGCNNSRYPDGKWKKRNNYIRFDEGWVDMRDEGLYEGVMICVSVVVVPNLENLANRNRITLRIGIC